jgi:hypothetical protein
MAPITYDPGDFTLTAFCCLVFIATIYVNGPPSPSAITYNKFRNLTSACLLIIFIQTFNNRIILDGIVLLFLSLVLYIRKRNLTFWHYIRNPLTKFESHIITFTLILIFLSLQKLSRNLQFNNPATLAITVGKISISEIYMIKRKLFDSKLTIESIPFNEYIIVLGLLLVLSGLSEVLFA